MAIVVVDLWTDGSGTTSGECGGWAYVLQSVHPVSGVEHVKEGSGNAMDTTNNRMEMTALLRGLEAITRPSLICVHTDSQYLMHPFTKGWMGTWEKKGWAKIKNVDLWLQIRAEVDKHIVAWEWVKGHSGEKWNERCDKLAGMQRRQAMEERLLPPVITPPLDTTALFP